MSPPPELEVVPDPEEAAWPLTVKRMEEMPKTERMLLGRMVSLPPSR